MKQLLLVTAISFSSLAYADNGFYTSLKAGISDTKLKSNEVNYAYPEDDYSEKYTQNNQTKSIYPNISVAVGYDFSVISPVNVRAELEYNYKDSTQFNSNTNQIITTEGDDSESQTGDELLFSNKVKAESLMLNSYYDFKNTSKFTPYISAGVGVTRVKNESTDIEFPDYSFSKSDNHFTWSAGVGVAYNITNNVALDASYRYLNAGKFEFSQDFDDDSQSVKYKLSSNDYSLGIRYNF